MNLLEKEITFLSVDRQTIFLDTHFLKQNIDSVNVFEAQFILLEIRIKGKNLTVPFTISNVEQVTLFFGK